jgi:formylmethanofuran dehydrogenase subunit E
MKLSSCEDCGLIPSTIEDGKERQKEELSVHLLGICCTCDCKKERRSFIPASVEVLSRYYRCDDCNERRTDVEYNTDEGAMLCRFCAYARREGRLR